MQRIEARCSRSNTHEDSKCFDYLIDLIPDCDFPVPDHKLPLLFLHGLPLLLDSSRQLLLHILVLKVIAISEDLPVHLNQAGILCKQLVISLLPERHIDRVIFLLL